MTTNSLSTRRRRRTGRIAIVAILISAIIVGGVVFFINVQSKTEPVVEETPAEETTPVEETPEENPEETTSSCSGSDKWNEVDQYEGDDPNTYETLTGSITHAESDGTNLVIRVNIDQNLPRPIGNCRLSLTSGDREFMTNTSIISTGSIYSSCEGFDIPLDQLAPGDWKIDILLTYGEKNGTLTGEVHL